MGYELLSSLLVKKASPPPFWYSRYEAAKFSLFAG